MADRGPSGLSQEEVERIAREEAKLERKIMLLLMQLASPEERSMMAEPIGWRPELPSIDRRRLRRYLQAHLDTRGGGSGIPPL
jgi:hypothetical protein